MTELEFRFQDMLDEVDALSKIAVDFIDAGHRSVLAELGTVLENIRDEPSERRRRWGIEQSNPLRTELSFGGYQKNNEGQHNIFAEITSAWEIQRIKPPGKRALRADRFALKGLASTCVRLMRKDAQDGTAEQLAMWRMEIGDSQSPGCHFHVQVLGESADPPFPKSLDVPRLPGIIATPLAVIEYVLAELFQDDWPKHVATQSAHLNRWAPIQKRRVTAVLDWQSKVVRESSGSPWATLKNNKPDVGIFLD
jgi:hypothetical protein